MQGVACNPRHIMPSKSDLHMQAVSCNLSLVFTCKILVGKEDTHRLRQTSFRQKTKSFSPNSVSTLRGPCSSVKGRGSIRVRTVGCSCCLRPLAQKFPCEMSMCMSTAQAVRFCLFRRSTFTGAQCSFCGLCPFFVAGVGISGHFAACNLVPRDRCRTSNMFSSA